MPRNQFQRMFFAFVTVVITVHAYVFYSLYVVNGNLLMSQKGKKPLPDGETDTVADIFRRMDEIKEEIRAEVMESMKK